MRLDEGKTFIRERSRLGKKYRSIYSDLIKLEEEIRNNPILGTSIGKGCRKIRMAISSKGKGESGGARIIVYVRLIADQATLLTIYDKSEKSNITESELDTLLNEIGG